jgi:hypothetical protein
LKLISDKFYLLGHHLKHHEIQQSPQKYKSRTSNWAACSAKTSTMSEYAEARKRMEAQSSLRRCLKTMQSHLQPHKSARMSCNTWHAAFD